MIYPINHHHIQSFPAFILTFSLQWLQRPSPIEDISFINFPTYNQPPLPANGGKSLLNPFLSPSKPVLGASQLSRSSLWRLQWRLLLVRQIPLVRTDDIKKKNITTYDGRRMTDDIGAYFSHEARHCFLFPFER